MKERVFYVINLDKQRIGVLSLFLFALFFSFFFLGVSVGKGRVEAASRLPEASTPETPAVKVDKEENHSNAVVSNEIKPQTSEIPMADVGTPSYFAETSTQKDEEEEKKAQVVELSTKKEQQTKVLKVSNLAPREHSDRVHKRTPKQITTSKEQYTIQLVAFSSRSKAEETVTKLKLENPKWKKSFFLVAKPSAYAVQFGKSSSKESLSNKLSQIKLPKGWKEKSILVPLAPLS